MCKVGFYGFNKTCWDTNECLRAASCPGNNVTCTNTNGGKLRAASCPGDNVTCTNTNGGRLFLCFERLYVLVSDLQCKLHNP